MCSKKKYMEIRLANIEQNLIELMANFLDSREFEENKAMGLFSEPKKRENTELHIRMAKVAMKEYRKSIQKIK